MKPICLQWPPRLVFLCSDHDGEEEDGDSMSFHLADEEEEDLNRIKEESRRRRQAILEKYKCQQLEKQVEPSLKESEKGKFLHWIGLHLFSIRKLRSSREASKYGLAYCQLFVHGLQFLIEVSYCTIVALHPSLSSTFLF